MNRWDDQGDPFAYDAEQIAEAQCEDWGDARRIRGAGEMESAGVGALVAAIVAFGTLNLALPMGPALGCWLVCVVLILGALAAYAEATR